LPHIPVEEWEKIIESSTCANRILNDPQFSFFLEYLKTARSSAIELIATNAIKEVIETVTNPAEGYSKTIKVTKEEQVNEVAGKIKFIDQLLTDLGRFATEKTEYEKKATEGQIVIDVDREDKK